MRAIYEPGEEAGEGAKLTLGLGDGDPETGEGETPPLVLRQGDPDPPEIPAAFEQACLDHPDVRTL